MELVYFRGFDWFVKNVVLIKPIYHWLFAYSWPDWIVLFLLNDVFDRIVSFPSPSPYLDDRKRGQAGRVVDVRSARDRDRYPARQDH